MSWLPLPFFLEPKQLKEFSSHHTDRRSCTSSGLCRWLRMNALVEEVDEEAGPSGTVAVWALDTSWSTLSGKKCPKEWRSRTCGLGHQV